MTEHDLALVERLRDGSASAVVEADDPAAVVHALVDAGARSVPPSEVPTWAAEARGLRALAEAVLAAEVVVDRVRSAEEARRRTVLDRSGAAAPLSDLTPSGDDHAPQVGHDGPDEVGPDGRVGDEDGPDADRAAVRFALIVLGIAQVGGVAVYLADGLLLAVAAPALAIAGVVAVAVAHRRPARGRDPAGGKATESPGEVPMGPRPEAWGARMHEPPVVRAAQAHLRRQQAAWKVAWWDRGLAPGDVTGWVGPAPAGARPATLVVADPGGEADDAVVAAMTAAVPATVRVVVVRSRPA